MQTTDRRSRISGRIGTEPVESHPERSTRIRSAAAAALTGGSLPCGPTSRSNRWRNFSGGMAGLLIQLGGINEPGYR